MSQSDYIKYKRVYTELSIDKNTLKQPPVFDDGNYIDFKEYALENTIVNTKPILNRITPAGKQVVYDMDRVVTSCPTFILCKNTNLRPNRVPMSGAFFVPTPQPLSWKATKNANFEKNGCICAINRSYTQKNLCRCRLSV